MISAEKEADILRHFHADRWPIGTIAREVGVHHETVRRVLRVTGVPVATLRPRASIIDPYLPFIREKLERHPQLLASRLWHMCRDLGFTGSQDHFRHRLAELRPRKAPEAFLRLRTLPGEQAQMDWGHFGTILVGATARRLIAFTMVLSYSRAIFLRFYFDAAVASLVRGHVDAFAFFGGVPRRVLYDNMKTAVLDRRRDAIRFHPRLVELAGHYRFEPRPVAPYRGNQKGRVERGIRYVRDSFFAGREVTTLERLNAEAEAWSTGIAQERRWVQDNSRLVRDAFAEERGILLPLPGDVFPTDEVVTVSVGKTPYVRFDRNDYSVPHRFVRQTLSVVASLERVRVLDGSGTVIADHSRCFERGQQREDPAHLTELVEWKGQARRERARDRLARAVPSTDTLMMRLAERGKSLGSATSALLRLLDRYGAEELEAAVLEALERGTPHLGAIHQVLDQHRAQRGAPPPVGPAFPADAKYRGLNVRPHALANYDAINCCSDEEESQIDQDD